ncbi:MAG: Hexuronate transporter [Sporomusa sp.]|nr:Hexuronate transporter [Sporomusa sp.]
MNKHVSEKRTNVRWVIAIFMWAAIAINYLDRTVMSAAAPSMMKDLNIGPTQMGIVMSSFFWSYAFFQIPSGWLADRIGQRVCLAGSVVWWSLATAVTALAKSANGLIGARIFMGIGEAGAYPCNAGVTAKWFPDKERGRVTAIFDSGTKFGTAFTMPLVAWMVAVYGWQLPFIVCGAVGLIWAVLWMAYYKDPEQHKYVNQAELKYIRDGQAKKEGIDNIQPMKWYELLKYRNVLAMCLGFFLFNYAIYFFITWFPTYLVKDRGMQLMTMGWFAMLPPLCGIIAQWTGGILTDYMYTKTGSLTKARKINMVGGMLLATSIAFAGFAESNTVAIVLLCVSYGGLAFAASAIWCLPGDVAPRNMTSVLGGIQNAASNCGGILGPIVTGYIIATTGSFVTALIISGICCLLGALVYLLMLKDIKPIDVPGASMR